MPKQIRPDEQEALIFHPREKQTEKEKLREMDFQGKLSYLWYYYKWYFIGTVAFIALVIYFTNAILHPSASPQFYAAIINNPIDDNTLKEYKDDFAKHLQLNPKKERVEFNTSVYYDNGSSYSSATAQALTTYMSTKQVDVIIAPESVFKTYAYNGTFKKLSDELPTDLYTSLTNQFYLSNTEGDKKENSVYGIYLTNTKLFQKNGDNNDPYVLGIVVNGQHEENTIKFIRYLFHIK